MTLFLENRHILTRAVLHFFPNQPVGLVRWPRIETYQPKKWQKNKQPINESGTFFGSYGETRNKYFLNGETRNKYFLNCWWTSFIFLFIFTNPNHGRGSAGLKIHGVRWNFSRTFRPLKVSLDPLNLPCNTKRVHFHFENEQKAVVKPYVRKSYMSAEFCTMTKSKQTNTIFCPCKISNI